MDPGSSAVTPVNPRGDDVNLRSGPQLLEYEAIVARIALDAPARILDWGCGYGQVSDMLLRAGLNVESFDYGGSGAPDGPVASERYPRVSAYISSDPIALPYADGDFDAVLSCGVLEHVGDPDASLEEIKRVLVAGGTFYVYKLPNQHSYLEAIARRIGLYYHGKLPDDRVYTTDGARELLARHGFDVRELRRSNVLPLTVSGRIGQRAATRIWRANRALERLPGINAMATNIELIARSPEGPSLG